jgi:hypothetical protein
LLIPDLVSVVAEYVLVPVDPRAPFQDIVNEMLEKKKQELELLEKKRKARLASFSASRS